MVCSVPCQGGMGLVRCWVAFEWAFQVGLSLSGFSAPEAGGPVCAILLRSTNLFSVEGI